MDGDLYNRYLIFVRILFIGYSRVGCIHVYLHHCPLIWVNLVTIEYCSAHTTCFAAGPSVSFSCCRAPRCAYPWRLRSSKPPGVVHSAVASNWSHDVYSEAAWRAGSHGCLRTLMKRYDSTTSPIDDGHVSRRCHSCRLALAKLVAASTHSQATQPANFSFWQRPRCWTAQGRHRCFSEQLFAIGAKLDDSS